MLNTNKMKMLLDLLGIGQSQFSSLSKKTDHPMSVGKINNLVSNKKEKNRAFLSDGEYKSLVEFLANSKDPQAIELRTIVFAKAAFVRCFADDIFLTAAGGLPVKKDNAKEVVKNYIEEFWANDFYESAKDLRAKKEVIQDEDLEEEVEEFHNSKEKYEKEVGVVEEQEIVVENVDSEFEEFLTEPSVDAIVEIDDVKEVSMDEEDLKQIEYDESENKIPDELTKKFDSFDFEDDFEDDDIQDNSLADRESQMEEHPDISELEDEFDYNTLPPESYSGSGSGSVIDDILNGNITADDDFSGTIDFDPDDD